MHISGDPGPFANLQHPFAQLPLLLSFGSVSANPLAVDLNMFRLWDILGDAFILTHNPAPGSR